MSHRQTYNHYQLNPSHTLEAGFPLNFASWTNVKKMIWLWVALNAPISSRITDLALILGISPTNVSHTWGFLEEYQAIQTLQMTELSQTSLTLPENFTILEASDKVIWLFATYLGFISVDDEFKINQMLCENQRTYQKITKNALLRGTLMYDANNPNRIIPTQLSQTKKVKSYMHPRFIQILNTHRFPFTNYVDFFTMKNIPDEMELLRPRAILIWLMIDYYSNVIYDYHLIALYLSMSNAEVRKYTFLLIELGFVECVTMNNKKSLILRVPEKYRSRVRGEVDNDSYYIFTRTTTTIQGIMLILNETPNGRFQKNDSTPALEGFPPKKVNFIQGELLESIQQGQIPEIDPYTLSPLERIPIELIQLGNLSVLMWIQTAQNPHNKIYHYGHLCNLFKCEEKACFDILQNLIQQGWVSKVSSLKFGFVLSAKFPNELYYINSNYIERECQNSDEKFKILKKRRMMINRMLKKLGIQLLKTADECQVADIPPIFSALSIYTLVVWLYIRHHGVVSKKNISDQVMLNPAILANCLSRLLREDLIQLITPKQYLQSIDTIYDGYLPTHTLELIQTKPKVPALPQPTKADSSEKMQPREEVPLPVQTKPTKADSSEEMQPRVRVSLPVQIPETTRLTYRVKPVSTKPRSRAGVKVQAQLTELIQAIPVRLEPVLASLEVDKIPRELASLGLRALIAWLCIQKHPNSSIPDLMLKLTWITPQVQQTLGHLLESNLIEFENAR